jgi:lysozyme family protein
MAGAALFAASNLQEKPMPTPTKPVASPAFNIATPKGSFKVALDAVLSDLVEGGFVNDPRDPGGATNRGVSLREVQRMDADLRFRDFVRELFDVDKDGDIDGADVPLWTREHTETFYRVCYWEKIRGSELPHPIAVIVFDSAVNEGVQKAAMHLQRSMGGLKVDGIVGDETVAATWRWKMLPGDFRPEEEVFLSRLDRYASLKNAPTYFTGWARRSFRMLKVSQS